MPTCPWGVASPVVLDHSTSSAELDSPLSSGAPPPPLLLSALPPGTALTRSGATGSYGAGGRSG